MRAIHSAFLERRLSILRQKMQSVSADIDASPAQCRAELVRQLGDLMIEAMKIEAELGDRWIAAQKANQ